MSAGEAGTSGSFIRDATEATFMRDVLEASRTVPVLVDFWAEWCGPCRQLTPVLEKVVTAARGRVHLVKVDIEACRSLASQLVQAGLPLQSIPLVAAFWKGQILDIFQGALPESQIRKFIEGVLSAAGGGQMPASDLLEAAALALEEGRDEDAVGFYSEVIGEEPENPQAWGGLVRTLASLGNEEAAAAALEDVPEKIAHHAEVEGARAALELRQEGRRAAAEAESLRARVEASPDDFEARCGLATALNAAGDREAAAEELLYVIRADREWKDGAAKQQLFRFFDAWGHDDPATLRARRRLSSLLFS
ncbi:tetratricopeptide repeat protein [Acetobacter sp. AN02]|nr:tetratricopeptide repeat protein [Acetobacter sp. AN02]MDG6094998.1 tetratricopeptide repeat protein [Acetobacter sp. AN02]